MVYYPVHLSVCPQAVRREDGPTRNEDPERYQLERPGTDSYGFQGLDGLVIPAARTAQRSQRAVPYQRHVEPLIWRICGG